MDRTDQPFTNLFGDAVEDGWEALGRTLVDEFAAEVGGRDEAAAMVRAIATAGNRRDAGYRPLTPGQAGTLLDSFARRQPKDGGSGRVVAFRQMADCAQHPATRKRAFVFQTMKNWLDKAFWPAGGPPPPRGRTAAAPRGHGKRLGA